MKIKGKVSGKWNAQGRDTWIINRNFFLKSPLLAHSSVITEIISKIKKKCRILEFGCGSGNYSIYLAKLGYDVVATDYEKSAVNLSRERARRFLSLEQLKRISFRTLDAENMDLPDNSYDLIFNVGTVEHLHIDKTLKECYRVLKNYGWNIAAVPFLSLRWDIFWKLSNYMSKNSPYTQFLSKEEWIRKFGEYFRQVKAKPCSFVTESFLMRLFGANINYGKLMPHFLSGFFNSEILVTGRKH